MKLSRIKNLKNNFKDFSKLFFPLNKRSNDYDLNYAYKADHHAKNDMSMIEINWIANNLLSKKNILDIGCNTGVSLYNLFKKVKSSNCKGIGIDINKDAVRIAKQKFKKLTFQHYIGNSIPFTNNNFDHIMIHHVIGHVENPKLLKKKEKRVLVVGGTISIVTPNWWYKFFQFPFYHHFIHCYHH